jgi:SAM-dependent methyltransferase
MKRKQLTDYEKYKQLQDPSTRDYDMSLVEYKDIEPYISPTMRVLDIGCKAGKLVSELRSRDINAWGIDIGKGCEKVWDDKYKSIRDRLICADFILYDFDTKFDCIILSHVLEHFYDPEKAMEKVYNLLDNGIAYCTFPIGDSYGAHYFTFESEDEIIPWFNRIWFNAEIINIDGNIYKVILRK